MPDPTPNAPDPNAPRLLYVSTLDHILWAMRPQLDEARARGWRVDVACHVTRSEGELLKHADTVYDFPFRRFPFHPANIAALLKLVKLINRNRYTIVHAHNPTGGFVGRLAATLANPRPLRVYTAHGFHFHPYGGRVTNALYEAIEGYAGRFLSDAVLTINKTDYENAKGRVVPDDRIFWTRGVGVSALDDFNPALVSQETRAALRAEVGAESDDTPVCIMVGEMIARKRHTDALHAFAKIRAQHSDALLLFVGVGALTETLQAEAQTLNIADGVKFLGFRRDVPALLAASDVFLFPPVQEGLPCATQEALCMETPAVVSAVRGNTDLMEGGVGGFLVPPFDPDAMAARALEILALPQEARKALGEAGRARMLKYYERGECVKELYDLYELLLTKILGLPAQTKEAVA